MLEDLEEIAKIASKAASLPNVALIEAASGTGLRVSIEHESSSFDSEGNVYFDLFPVQVRITDQLKNWRTVFKVALQVKRDLWRAGDQKWRLGDLTREKSDNEYTLVVNLQVATFL